MRLDQKEAKDTKGSMLTSKTTCLVKLTPGARPLEGPATATARLLAAPLLAALFSDIFCVDVGVGTMPVLSQANARSIQHQSDIMFASLDRFGGGS
jgi:hypothetical protein